MNKRATALSLLLCFVWLSQTACSSDSTNMPLEATATAAPSRGEYEAATKAIVSCVEQSGAMADFEEKYGRWFLFTDDAEALGICEDSVNVNTIASYEQWFFDPEGSGDDKTFECFVSRGVLAEGAIYSAESFGMVVDTLSETQSEERLATLEGCFYDPLDRSGWKSATTDG